jgi:hypothetical protein
MESPKIFVDIESPYGGKTLKDIHTNLLFARACSRDCLLRGEIPIASHLLYTQPGILDDTIEEERLKGIMAGKHVANQLNATAIVYENLGYSKGMRFGIELAIKHGRKVEYRKLNEDWLQIEKEIAAKHAHASIWGICLDSEG